MLKGMKKLSVKKLFTGGKKKRIIIGLAAVVIVAGAGWFIYSKFFVSTDATTQETLSTVTRGDLKDDVSGDGTAEISSVNIDFENNGKLKALYVKEGDQIKKGQVLAKLDDTDYVNKLAIAKSNYDKSLADMTSAKSNNQLALINEKQQLDTARLTLQQTKAEYDSMKNAERAYSKQDIDNKAISLENAQNSYATESKRYVTQQRLSSDFSVEKANIESAKVSYETAQNDLAKTVLHAPADGMVLNIAYSVGESVTAPTSSTSTVTADTTHFMVVSGSNSVNVNVPVSEDDFSKITVGQIAETEFEAYAGETFTGKVISIKALPAIDSNNLVTYQVKILLDGSQTKVKSGMTGSVSFIIKEKKNVLTIPNKAVTYSNGKQTVQVRKQDGSNETRQIKTGFTDGKSAEVISGLKQGESVVIVSAVTAAAATSTQAGGSNAPQ